ncbi:hypothetical protein NXS19_007662 [Fusarium pseudograminearum]|nr:hypothetical protein NXS19_007662 [Fusarium pseudograminearum]
MMGVSRSRRQSLDCHAIPPSPQPSSAFEDIFDVDSPVSRPVSEAFMSGASTPNGSTSSRPPSLTEILLDVASPPWTLSAFMAYLSQNHCMESLEFTLDSQRYAAFYNEIITNNSNRTQEDNDRVCVLWEKLMQVYIIPCAPREVNLPARIRDQLLGLPCGPSPPHPAQLEEAGRILYELMNDSLLVPFLQSVAPMHVDGSTEEHGRGSRRSSNSNTRMGAPVRSMNSMHHHHEPESLTDDSDCNSTPEETHETGGARFGPPLHGTLHAADDGWHHNPDLRQDGGFGNGTTAKFDTVRNGVKTSLVQKNIRMRRRSNKHHDFVATVQPLAGNHAAESQGTSYRHDLPLLSISPVCAGGNVQAAQVPMVDVSNYLPTPTTSSEDIGSPSTASDHQAFRYASPVEDMYGWDAELERRRSPSRSSMSSNEGCDAIALSYRRANGSKHSLLQRVFRVSSSTSMAKLEAAT